MEKLPVQLDIPLAWNLWGIYQISDSNKNRNLGDLDVYRNYTKYDGKWGYRYIRCQDPIDRDGFDDATSFPAFKPDRDVFGPPERCRKQRGWYHVRRRPPVAHTSEEPVRLAYAAGADVPQELFDTIIHCCKSDTNWGKVELGRLRLVCRRWENLFLDNMFRIVNGSGANRLKDLLALQDARMARGWRAYPIIRVDFSMDLSMHTQPWLQRVTGLGIRLPSKLRINGPIHAGRRLTSVYLSSPCRALWNPVSIQKLYLNDIHFKKPGDLVRMLRELPFLHSVEGEKVTWDSSLEKCPRVMTFIPHTSPSPSIEYRFVDSQAGISGILSCALSHPGTGSILQTDADALYRIAVDLDVQISSRNLHKVWFAGVNSASPSVNVWLKPKQTGAPAYTVQSLTFDFTDCDTTSPVLTPWDAVATHIESLSVRPEVLLVFSCMMHLSLFHEDVAIPKMTSLDASGRLKYALSNWKEDKLSLVEDNGNGGWITLAEMSYDVNMMYEERRDPDVSGSYAHALRRLSMWRVNL